MTLATAANREAAKQFYGVQETNGIPDDYSFDREEVTLSELAARGGKITRVRLLTERWPSGRMCDISYIHGVLADGTAVRIRETYHCGGLLRTLKKQFIEWAKEEKVYAKGLGLLDEGNWSVLY